MHPSCQLCGRLLPAILERSVCVPCALGNALENEENQELTGAAALSDGTFKTEVIHWPSDAFAPNKSEATSFGDYEVLEEIGRGGMGVVYRARQQSLSRLVAIKRVLPEVHASFAAKRRFQAEAEAAARLRHPGIVGIYEVGQHDGQPFLSMELVDGQAMDSMLRRGPIPAVQSARIVSKIAEAVHYAHEQGVLHRDLKPSNILIDANENPVVTDFGLAKRMWVESDLTVPGQVMGTPSFMAPEQVSPKEAQVGRWTDIYSLGAILYHTATGRPPFQAASTEATLRDLLLTEPVAPKTLNPSLPRDLQTICLKCLEKEPSKRYATAQELAEDLNRFLTGQPIRARPVSSPEKVWRWCRRKPGMASLAASVIILLTAIMVGSVFSAYRISNLLQAERQENYFNDIARAYNFVRDNQFNRARQILNRQDFASYRSWEWGHLQWLCHQDAMTFKGAVNAPQQVAFSPDDRFLAVTSRDGKLKIWNTSTGEVHWERTVHSGNTVGLAFSTDGGRIFTSSYIDSEVRVWDFRTGEKIASFKPGLWYPVRLACSPDGQWLAVSGYKGVELRNAEDYSLVRTLNGHGDRVLALAFKHDSRVLASGGGNPFPDETSKDGSIILWDVNTGRAIHKMTGPMDTVRGLEFSGDGRQLASIGIQRDNRRWGSMGIGGTMKLWNAATGELIQNFKHTLSSNKPWNMDVGFEVAFCHGDKFLLSGHLDSQIWVWDAAKASEVKRIQGHTTHVHALAMSHGGKLLASASYDGTVKLWSSNRLVAPSHLSAHKQPVWALSFSSDSTRLATGSWDGTVKIWDPNNRTLKRSIPVGVPVIALDYSPDGQRLATVGSEYKAFIWDAVQGERLIQLEGHSNTVLCVSYNRSGTQLATGSKDRTIRVWDAKTGEVQATLEDHKGWVFDLDFSSDHQRLVSAGGDRTVKLWNMKTGSLLQTWRGHSGAVLCVRFSPDGRWIASGSLDQTVRIWNAESGELHRVLEGHKLQGAIKSLSWSPDSRRLVTASSSIVLYRPALRDFKVRMWDVETGRDLLALDGNTDCIYALAFSHDGRYLASGDADCRVQLFSAIPWEKPSTIAGDASPKNWVEQWKRSLLYRKQVESAGETSFTHSPEKKEQPATSEEFSFRSPERSRETPPELLDLTRFYNASLERDWTPYWRLSDLDKNLAQLPQGIHKFLDVKFDVRGIIQLRSIEPGWESFPKQVTGIPIGFKVSTIHVLHGTAYHEAPGEIIAAYVLNYADGTVAELPVKYGRNVWAWADQWARLPPEERKVAWKAANHANSLEKASFSIFQSDWENPHPDKVVETIGFVSRMSRSAPFLIAVTVQ